MANKPAATRYSEFRHFADWCRGGKARIKRELLPPIAAYLLMLGRRYRKAADGLSHALVTRTVPGMAESRARMLAAEEHLQWVMNELPVNFDGQDWREAVTEICRLMDIQTGQEPIVDIGDDAFASVLPEAPHANDTSGSGAPVQLSVGTGAGGETGQRGDVEGRPGSAGKKAPRAVPGKRRNKRK